MGAVLGSSGLIMTGCGMTDEQQKALDSVVNKADEIIELASFKYVYATLLPSAN